MKNIYLDNLLSILTSIHDNGIVTQNQLVVKNRKMNDMLYFAVEAYIENIVLRSKNHTNKKGELVSGNKDKVQFILNNSSYEMEDIISTSVLKVMSVLDKVFDRPVNAQPYYIYTVVNNRINDFLRELEIIPDSIDRTVECSDNDSNKSCTLGELIPDYTHNPEYTLIRHETNKELQFLLKAKREEEFNNKRTEIIKAMKLLSAKPAEVIAHMSKVLGMKNKQFKDNLISNGAVDTSAHVLYEICKKYKISPSELRTYIKVENITDKLFKLDSNNEAMVAHQISELRSRAKARLDSERDKTMTQTHYINNTSASA